MFGINQLQQVDPLSTAFENQREIDRLNAQAEKDRASAKKWLIFTGLVLVGAGIWEYQRSK